MPPAVRAPYRSDRRPASDALAEATLEAPLGGAFESTGKFGHHSEHMSYLLGEMQGLARQHPGANW